MLETKYIEVAEEISKKISEREWIGKLPGVSKIAAGMGVDPKTVNKAVHYLSDRKLVKVIPKSGTWIVLR